MAQAAWVEVTKQQSVRVTAYAPAWALGGCALMLLTLGAVATIDAHDPRSALARLLAVAAGVLLCIVAAWIAQLESARLLEMRLMDIAGFAASIAVLAVAGAFFIRRPDNGGPYAGALVALLPLAFLTLLHGQGWEGARTRTPAALLAWAALAAGGAALLMCNERSALLALLLGAAGAGCAYWLAGVTRHAGWIWALLTLCGIVALLLWYVLGGALPGWLVERVDLWRDALPLVRDYRFVGIGPANTEMVFASYALLTHVPYVAQVHNLYLQVALEYGMVGLAALLGMFAAALVAAWQALRHGTGATRLRAAAVLAALLTTLLLGVVDAEIVASHMVVTLFAPLAAALLVQATARAQAYEDGVLEFPARSGPPSPSAARPGLWLLIAGLGFVPVLLLWGYGARTQIEAAWDANQGALQQAQVELTNYAQANWPFQDAIRVAKADALPAPEMAYRSALLLNPAQETAHRRLGQIALSLGDVARAATFLEEAHRLSPQNRATAQLLGEVRALQGDAAAAAALWQPLPMLHNQLETRLNWYRARAESEPQAAANLARMEAAVAAYAEAIQAEAIQQEVAP